ncbi:MAG: SPASM domain-containing protein [Rickettsiales bacterium]|jgi:MoaA/NifB/PqqE/SkfB family radical SAM enzyme|nr:SPASM domain-containing protein [Rickettsiales bacterium]
MNICHLLSGNQRRFDIVAKRLADYQPRRVRLDACSLCQLNCKDCYMRKFNNCNFGAGYLTYKNFEKFLDLNPSLTEVELSNNGEIFLNPDLVEIMRLAHSRFVRLTAINGVNLNSVSDDVLEAIVKYKFGIMTISIDGWDQASYSAYRRGGNFNTVIGNIKKINVLKKKYNSEFPHLVYKCIIMESTDDISGIRRVKKLADELNMYMDFALDWGGYAPKDPDAVKNETGMDIPKPGVSYEGRDANSRYYDRWCYQVINEPQINWDGRFFGCCRSDNPLAPGNLFEISLRDFFHTQAAQDLFRSLCGISGNASPCETCQFYQSMRRQKNWLHRDEIYQDNLI